MTYSGHCTAKGDPCWRKWAKSPGAVRGAKWKCMRLLGRNKRLQRANRLWRRLGETLLNVGKCTEYGVPRTGYIFYPVRRSRTLVLSQLCTTSMEKGGMSTVWASTGVILSTAKRLSNTRPHDRRGGLSGRATGNIQMYTSGCLLSLAAQTPPRPELVGWREEMGRGGGKTGDLSGG